MTGVPDRVPLLAQLHEFAMQETRAAAREFYSTPELLTVATLKTHAKYGIDVPVLDYDVYNIEAEAIGQAIRYSDTDMPDVDRSRPLIRDRDDLNKIRTPDFESDGRFRQVIEMNKLFRSLIGPGVDATVRFCAPFSLAANIRGIEQLILDIYSAPQFARDLFDRITEELLAPWIQRLQTEFPAAQRFSGDDATASLPIVNLDILENWIVPYIERLRELCGPQVCVPNWVGESLLDNPTEMLDLKRRVCPGFLEGQDPDVEKLGPQFYKEYAQENGLPLILGIGIDDGVHVVHDYLRQKGPFAISHSTASALIITSATTMIGFGSMMFARHQGLRSLGQVLTIGVFCCLLSSLLVLPPLLRCLRPASQLEGEVVS